MPARKAADDAIRASSGLAMDLVHGNQEVLLCLDQTVANIRDQPRFQVLRAQVDKHLDFLTSTWSIDHWAWSLELCTNSFLETGSIRVHLHIYLHRDNGRIKSRNVKNWHFQQSIPRVSTLTNVRNRATTAFSGVFISLAMASLDAFQMRRAWFHIEILWSSLNGC